MEKKRHHNSSQKKSTGSLLTLLEIGIARRTGRLNDDEGKAKLRESKDDELALKKNCLRKDNFFNVNSGSLDALQSKTHCLRTVYRNSFDFCVKPSAVGYVLMGKQFPCRLKSERSTFSR